MYLECLTRNVLRVFEKVSRLLVPFKLFLGSHSIYTHIYKWTPTPTCACRVIRSRGYIISLSICVYKKINSATAGGNSGDLM